MVVEAPGCLIQWDRAKISVHGFRSSDGFGGDSRFCTWGVQVRLGVLEICR